jgi:hypothetical protein
MNPFWWLLWAVVALFILFVASATFAAVVEQIKGPKRCPGCGLTAEEAKDRRREMN